MVSERQEREDREFVREIALMFAEARGNTAHRYCETEGCWWGAHCKTVAEAQAEYEAHLRTSARHNDKPWTDRYGRKWRGLQRVRDTD